MDNKNQDIHGEEQPAAVSASAEEYLESLCRLRDRGEELTVTALARELRIAPPSVLGMLKRMTEQGLILYSRRTGILLTARGEYCAARLRRRHRLAERLLTDLLGLPWARAHEIACRFEHVIDDEVEPYLLAALHHPTTCPHGNPIVLDNPPGGVPLAALTVGQSACVARVVDESDALLDYLAQLRMVPGAWLTVVEIAPFQGPMLVEVEGVRHALARAVTEHLQVIEEQAGVSRPQRAVAV